ncbi:hypothetical protein MFS40622_1195 [Methanocaldococcus sp. FS406-22]|uniref:NDR1/HIN1-like protein n=1 Tax=Methanocaldococcus sp. (strain FS406-22) TaxID=644281 RepID=UPI0001BF2A34|nr:LEA type 2 family protein [Methanocaldococcus sp. FS406-22]ADC69872.1 hypothetical protein MFS40622_1195 [Methanocaldococcus sp. FS406-22]
MDSLKKGIMFSLVAMLCIIAGCTSEPEIKSPTTYVKIKSSFSDDLKTTNLDVKVIVDNPNPIGIHINKVKFDVYLLDNGEKVILKQVKKSDIDIKESGTTPIDFQISIPNDKIMSAIKNSKNGKITIGVDGYALVDAKISEIEVPIKGETEIAIPNIKSPITNVEINVKPGVPTKIDAKITINNPNNIGVKIKELVADVYYMDNYGNNVKQIKHIEKQNIYIKENGITTIDIPITIGLNDLPSPDYVIENGGNIIIGVDGYAVVDAKIKEIKIPITGKTTFESPFQLSDNSQLPLPNPPQPPQLPNISVIIPPLPQPPQLPDPLEILNELISSSNANNNEYSQYYIGIIDKNGNIPDTIYAQKPYYIVVIDSNGNLTEGVDIYINGQYMGTIDESGILPCIFCESGYYTITAEYNGDVLASKTVYVEEVTKYNSGKSESYDEYGNNYESYDQQQTQTQQSEIKISVDDITLHNELIIKKIVMSPDLLLMLAGMPPELKITMENGEEINLKYISMDVDLIIYNPNSKSVTIDKLILNMVDDEGHSLGKGEISDITITPGENPVTVKVDIPINKMGYEILRKLNGEEVFAEISGSAYIGDEEIPFSGERELLPPLPKPPVPLPPLPPFPTE